MCCKRPCGLNPGIKDYIIDSIIKYNPASLKIISPYEHINALISVTYLDALADLQPHLFGPWRYHCKQYSISQRRFRLGCERLATGVLSNIADNPILPYNHSMKNDILSLIRNDLQQNIDEHTKDTAHRFFKEEVKFYGVKTALVGKLAKKYFEDIKNKTKGEIFALCEELLCSDYSEEAFIAFDWAYRLRSDYEPDDFKIFERWLEQYVNNWAKCDVLCNHTIGSFIEQYPHYIEYLKTWTQSENRWLRRASAVTLVLPARNGKFLDDIFEIASLLRQDKDDLVQKGYGWMLKEASKAHQSEVFSYIMNNKKEMPRTALRYAIEKMPQELRSKAMAKD